MLRSYRYIPLGSSSEKEELRSTLLWAMLADLHFAQYSACAHDATFGTRQAL